VRQKTKMELSFHSYRTRRGEKGESWRGREKRATQKRAYTTGKKPRGDVPLPSREES